MLNKFRQLSAIVNKLGGIDGKCVSKKELLEAMSGEMDENGSCTLRTLQRDRLLFYGSRLVTSQVRRGDEEYALSPVKVICIMNCEDDHPNSPPDKILYHYRLQEVGTAEPFGGRISFYLLELPRIMRYTDDYDSPVAAWCRIFRNFAIFAKSRSEKDAEFAALERAMRVSGLDDREIDNYFSDMMTEKEMRPYIEGAEQQGYRRGFEA